jgi:ribosomal protein L37E
MAFRNHVGQVYILKLEGNKWYVGYTERAIKRVLQHAEKKGAKWTKKYKPIEPIPYSMSEPIYSTKDEDRITLSLMAEHGIINVRGGRWCMVNMSQRTVKELRGLVPKINKSDNCTRCGRNSHSREQCYAATTIDGVRINQKNWNYKPIKRKKKVMTENKSINNIQSSIESLKSRNVFCEDDSKNLNVRGMWREFNRYASDEKLGDKKWHQVLLDNYNKYRRRPLHSLYPKDHWFHNKEAFDEKLSNEFEQSGYLWTSSGAAVNPKIRQMRIDEQQRLAEEQQAQAEKRREEKQKARELAQLEREKQIQQRQKEQEERQREIQRQREIELQRIEKEKLEAENHKHNCINKLRKRGVLIEHSQAMTHTTFTRSLSHNPDNDEISLKWRDYFNSVSRNIDLSPLYPQDHWLHNPDNFNRVISQEFEYDGFGWTESGTASRHPSPSESLKVDSDIDDSSTDPIDVIVKSITKEVEKVGKSVKKKLGKVKKNFKKRMGF